jgi:hypothetical protein
MKVHFLIVDTSCDKFQFLFKVNSTEVSLLPLNSLERAHKSRTLTMGAPAGSTMYVLSVFFYTLNTVFSVCSACSALNLWFQEVNLKKKIMLCNLALIFLI